MSVYENITQMVGKTPLLKLNKLTSGLSASVLVKMETQNPFSVKDRVGIAMIEAAEKNGSLKPGGTIVEATSGNTGIALGFVAAKRGYKLILTMPETMSAERRKLLSALGIELELTPGSEGMSGAVKKADELVEAIPNAVAMKQFENPANPDIHEKTTGVEIWKDTDGKVDVFVAGVGTGGTFSGIGRALKKRNPEVKLVALEPADSPVLSEGKAGAHNIQGIGANFIPENLDVTLINEIIQAKGEDAQNISRLLAKKEGILCGISSGANVWAALELAKRAENVGKTIVTVICDSGERYLSTDLFE